ncbi:HAD family hydrolase [Aquabacter sp. CN5-332]|uniref:HAD family hydrolase n=1 Tax=Aquabacter sp. CN5-332 TaxID=3156608 RepID=UPI0032B32195
MRGLKALLFDKDGTLVHFDRTWGPAAGAVMRTLAEGNPAALKRLEEVSEYLPDEERFLPSSPLVAGSSAHYGPLWAEALGCPADKDFLGLIDHLFREGGLHHLTPIGRPAEVLKHLRDAGLRLAIVTNDAEASARDQARALGVLSYFDAVHGYDSGYGSKPDPGMVSAVAEQFALEPQEMAVIGDSVHDFTAARSAGARFILVRTGPAPVEHLYGEADLVVDSIDDLPAHLLEAVPC